MITTAIAKLKENNGSKTNDRILMVEHSYTLPGSAFPAANNRLSDAISSDPARAGTKRRRGRPRKTRADTLQAAVPVFPPEMDMNVVPAAVPADEAPQGGTDAMSRTVRGRGRPPKLVGFRPKPGRPAKVSTGIVSTGTVSTGTRGRGRPRKHPITDNLTAQEKGPVRPRGRPPKSLNVLEFAGALVGSGGVVVGDGISPVIVKRRGRPPKAGGGQAKIPRVLGAGEPRRRGRPRKSVAVPLVNPAPDSELLVAYIDLKGKLENLRSRVAETATVIRPFLNNDAAIHALEELQLLAMKVNVHDKLPTQGEQSQSQN